MIEKNGKFTLGESYVDDGSGLKASISPQTIDELIFSELEQDTINKAAAAGTPRLRAVTASELCRETPKQGS